MSEEENRSPFSWDNLVESFTSETEESSEDESAEKIILDSVSPTAPEYYSGRHELKLSESVISEIAKILSVPLRGSSESAHAAHADREFRKRRLDSIDRYFRGNTPENMTWLGFNDEVVAGKFYVGNLSFDAVSSVVRNAVGPDHHYNTLLSYPLACHKVWSSIEDYDVEDDDRIVIPFCDVLIGKYSAQDGFLVDESLMYSQRDEVYSYSISGFGIESESKGMKIFHKHLDNLKHPCFRDQIYPGSLAIIYYNIVQLSRNSGGWYVDDIDIDTDLGALFCSLNENCDEYRRQKRWLPGTDIKPQSLIETLGITDDHETATEFTKAIGFEFKFPET